MATGKDLIEAVKSSLENDGYLGMVKAELQTKVMKLLESPQNSSRIKIEQVDTDITILNELIREYLDWMGFKYSSNIFASESSLPKEPTDRIFLQESLGVQDSEITKDLPLIFNIVQTFKQLKK